MFFLKDVKDASSVGLLKPILVFFPAYRAFFNKENEKKVTNKLTFMFLFLC
jgi:hypothetical protein